VADGITKDAAAAQITGGLPQVEIPHPLPQALHGEPKRWGKHPRRCQIALGTEPGGAGSEHQGGIERADAQARHRSETPGCP